MIRAVLFDLDDTLIDTAPIRAHREARRWKVCVARASSTHVYDGIHSLVQSLGKAGTLIGVVTSSVSYYAENLLRHHAIPYDTLVAYHDAKPPKPSPAPIQAALRRLDIDAAQALGVGDREEDALSCVRADVLAYGAGWSPHLARDCGWDGVFEEPDEILHFLKSTG